MKIVLSKYYNKQYLIYFILFIAFIIRLFFAKYDPFLHDWDERFHALVAKNMIENPLKPMLYKNPILEYDINEWSTNSIWLHKQPLFLWLMALSMKIFGINEVAMRLPSILMGVFSIYFIYKITFHFSNKINVAILSALLFCFSNYALFLISGINGMDHNDVAMCFFIIASFWALSEYIISSKKYWVLWIGFFAGCAILNKWLTGLLVFAPWFFLVLNHFIKKKSIKEFYYFAIALFIACIVFLPWQLFILHQYPLQAKFEYAYNNLHISLPVEGHDGSIWYYVNLFDSYFGYLLCIFFFSGLIFSFISLKNLNKRILFSILFSIVLVFCFFSYIVMTKLPSYLFIIIPFCYMFMAFSINYLFENLSIPKWTRGILVSIILILSINPVQLYYQYSTKENLYRNKKIFNTHLLKKIKKELNNNVVLFNLNKHQEIEAMFYYNNITCYSKIPTQEDIKIINQAGKNIYLLNKENDKPFPKYLLNNPSIKILDDTLMSVE